MHNILGRPLAIKGTIQTWDVKHYREKKRANRSRKTMCTKPKIVLSHPHKQNSGYISNHIIVERRNDNLCIFNARTKQLVHLFTMAYNIEFVCVRKHHKAKMSWQVTSLHNYSIKLC